MENDVDCLNVVYVKIRMLVDIYGGQLIIYALILAI